MTIKKLSDRIREKRKELRMSQEELARLAGYTDRSTISRIEKGLIDLSESKIMAIASALNTTPGYLVGWEESVTKAKDEIASLNDGRYISKKQIKERLKELKLVPKENFTEEHKELIEIYEKLNKSFDKNEEILISKEQQLINTISNYLNENSKVTLSEIKRGNKVDVINFNKNVVATYDVEVVLKAYEIKFIKQQFSLDDIQNLLDRYQIPDELKGVTRKQYIKFMGESAMFFDDADISDETKEKMLLSFQHIFYDAKERNKRKK